MCWCCACVWCVYDDLLVCVVLVGLLLLWVYLCFRSLSFSCVVGLA